MIRYARMTGADFSANRIRACCELFSGVDDVPERARAVVGDEERTVRSDGDADGTTPDLTVLGDEAVEEVVGFAVGVAVLHGDEDDVVAGAVLAVPGAMLGSEGAAGVIRPRANPSAVDL